MVLAAKPPSNLPQGVAGLLRSVFPGFAAKPVVPESCLGGHFACVRGLCFLVFSAVPITDVYVDLGANYMHCVTRYRRRRARPSPSGVRKGTGASHSKDLVSGRCERAGVDKGGTGKTPFGFAGPLRDCRWRREPSRSVSGIAAVLKPLVADVCGKQNWESTFFCK